MALSGGWDCNSWLTFQGLTFTTSRPRQVTRPRSSAVVPTPGVTYLSRVPKAPTLLCSHHNTHKFQVIAHVAVAVTSSQWSTPVLRKVTVMQ